MSMKADDKDYSKKEAQHVAQANVTPMVIIKKFKLVKNIGKMF